MKTFAEKYNAQFNWYEFLNNKFPSTMQLIIAKEKASRWVTCAVGNQCEVIPRHMDGTPTDHILLDQGFLFNHAINEMCVCCNSFDLRDYHRERAMHILGNIEKRVAQILRSMKTRSRFYLRNRKIIYAKRYNRVIPIA